MARVATDRSAEIEHHRLTFEIRPKGGNRGAIDPRHGTQVDLRCGHQCAGVTGGYRNIGLSFLDSIDGKPHGRSPTPFAKCLTGFVVHLHRHISVHQVRGGLELRPRLEQRLHDKAIAEQ